MIGDLDTLLELRDRFCNSKTERKSYLTSICALSRADSPANIHHVTHKPIPTTGILVAYKQCRCDVFRENPLVLSDADVRERKFQKSLRSSLQESWSNMASTITTLCTDKDVPIDFVKGVAFVLYGILKAYPKQATELFARANLMHRVVWEEEAKPTILYLLKHESFQEDQRDNIYLNTLHYGFCRTHGVIPKK